MVIWKHKQWETFPGTWMIATVLTDDEVIAAIKANPSKYGNFKDWKKQK